MKKTINTVFCVFTTWRPMWGENTQVKRFNLNKKRYMGGEDTKEKLERLRAIRRANPGVITKKTGDANAILGIRGTLNSNQEAQLDVINRQLETN